MALFREIQRKCRAKNDGAEKTTRWITAVAATLRLKLMMSLLTHQCSDYEDVLSVIQPGLPHGQLIVNPVHTFFLDVIDAYVPALLEQIHWYCQDDAVSISIAERAVGKARTAKAAERQKKAK